MSTTLTAVPMFAPGKTVRVARMVRNGNVGKRMERGTYEVVSTGAYDVRFGFVYTLKTPAGETRLVCERYLVPSEGWSDWYATRMAERAERETARAWAMWAER